MPTHRAPNAAMVTMKSALGAAQRVVFENHSQVRAGVSGDGRLPFVLGDEGGAQIGDADLGFEAVLLKARGQRMNRVVFFKADLGIARDLVAEGEHVGVHKLLGARDYFVTLFIRSGQFRNQALDVERLFKRVQLFNDAFGRLTLGRRILRGSGKREGESQQEEFRACIGHDEQSRTAPYPGRAK